MANFEIVTPIITNLAREELRMPIPGEVVLAQDISFEEILQCRIGNLAIMGRSGKFVGNYIGWHYDSIHTQGHFTDKGKVRVSFAGIAGHLPSRSEVRLITDELDEKAITIDVSSGDLLAFGGSRSQIPILHTVRALDEPRESYFLILQTK